VSNAYTRPPSKPTRQWRRPVIEENIKPHPAPLAALFGAGGAIAFGLIATFAVVMAAWLIAAHGNESVNQVAAAGGIAWLGLQLVPITIGTQVIGLLPWGFIVLPIYLVWRSTEWALKSADPQTAKDYWSVAGILAGSYGLINALLAVLASTTGLSANFLITALRTSGLAAIVAVACVLTYAPSRSVLLDQLPEAIRDGVKPGFATFMVLALAGAGLSTISLISHFKEVSAVAQVMAPQAYDGFFLLLLGIGYLPTAAVWAMSYLIGPGVVVGGSGVVSMYHANPGALPAFPLLSLLPNSAPSWAKFLILVPVAAGILLYLLLPRQQWQAQGDSAIEALTNIIRPREFVSLASALAVTASCSLLAAVAASGSLGTQFLKFVGPQPLVLALALTLILGITVCVLLLLPRLLLVLVYLWQHRSAVEDESGN
jgi:hypothetical protein